MAPATFHLISLKQSVSRPTFIQAVREQPTPRRPYYVGETQHWIHAPHLSSDALTGTEGVMQSWDYLILTNASSADSLSFPETLSRFVAKRWSLTVGIDDQQLDGVAEEKQRRSSQATPPLPSGWTPEDHTGLDASDPPSDLEASLALSSYRLGSPKDASNQPVILKDWVADFGTRHAGPVDMFNLLSYMPEGQPRYFRYVAAFQESVGIKYGGEPAFLGFGGIGNWSSKAQENYKRGEDWEHVALIHYPSIWHFAKMLDDPAYAEVDRSFKQGAIRDNPLICCTEVDID